MQRDWKKRVLQAVPAVSHSLHPPTLGVHTPTRAWLLLIREDVASAAIRPCSQLHTHWKCMTQVMNPPVPGNALCRKQKLESPGVKVLSGYYFVTKWRKKKGRWEMRTFRVKVWRNQAFLLLLFFRHMSMLSMNMVCMDDLWMVVGSQQEGNIEGRRNAIPFTTLSR